MNIKPIHTERDYEAALKAVEELTVPRGQSQPPFHFTSFLAENPVALALSVGCSVSLH